MIKVISKVKIYSLVLICLLFLVGCSLKQMSKSEKSSSEKLGSSYFSTYNPNADIKSFEFINDKNGIVVEWEYDEKERAESKKIDSPDWISVNSRFLVRPRQKIRKSSVTKAMKSDEYSYLDIFDLSTPKAQKTEVDLWKTLVDYLQTDDFSLAGSLETLKTIDGNDFIVVMIRESQKYRYFLLNLKTLKIEGEKSYNDLNDSNFFVLHLSTSSEYTAGVKHFHNSFWKKEDYSGEINLKNSNKKVYDLFSKKNVYAYKVINSIDGDIVNGAETIELESQFLKIGKSVYDDAYLPAEWSTQGVDTKISNYDELLKYYNGIRPESY